MHTAQIFALFITELSIGFLPHPSEGRGSIIMVSIPAWGLKAIGVNSIRGGIHVRPHCFCVLAVNKRERQ